MKKAFRVLADAYRRYVPNIAILFLFPVSCWSTYSGLRELMRSTAGLGDTEGWLVSIGLTCGIQITLLYAVASIIRARRQRRLLYFGIYCLTVFFSVLFGYAFYFRHLQADDFARETHFQESQRLLLDAEDFKAEFLTIAGGLDELAAFSAVRSQVEDERGNTCGDDSPSGRGPRARGRRQDADVFRGYNNRIQDLNRQIESGVEKLQADIGRYDSANLELHHHNIDRFYQNLAGQRGQAEGLLSEIKSYIEQRFPAGLYTIREGSRIYPCPDSRLEHLAGVILDQQAPALPPPPRKFEAYNPKAVVHQAMNEMASTIWEALAWFRGGGSAPPPTGTAAGAAGAVAASGGRLPLFLGLLVDCLIFLAAFARMRGSATESALQRVGELNRLPVHVRADLSKQLAGLLGCAPASAKFAAYSILKRYEIRARMGWEDQVRRRSSPSAIAVPKTGGFLDRFPEVSRVEDLVRLLEALQLASCRTPDLKWSQLPAALPLGLAEIRARAGDDLENELVELYRLDERLMGDLVKEAFVTDAMPHAEPENESAGVGAAGESPVSI